MAENCPLLKKKNNVKSFILNIFIPSLTCHAVGIVIYIDKTKYVYQNIGKEWTKNTAVRLVLYICLAPATHLGCITKLSKKRV